MRLFVAIALAVLYAGLSLAFGGVRSGGFAWWFFLPAILVLFGTLLWLVVSMGLPSARRDGLPPSHRPRRVHLSWRAAVGLPVVVPAVLIPWNMFAILRMHLELPWLPPLLGVVAMTALAAVAFKCRREIRLLREGEVALATVLSRQVSGEPHDRIDYSFKANGAATVSNRTYTLESGLAVGSDVPVFYEAKNPANHVVACSSWFEAA